MGDWTTGHAEADGVRLHYARTGGAKPPVVLAHGVTDDGPCWAPVASALEADHDLVMVDACGHGRSDAPECGYGPVEQAGDLAAVMAALGLRRPAVLGPSRGAATALAVAGARPDLLGALLLEAPPPGAPPVDEEAGARMCAGFAALTRKTREVLVAEQRAAALGWSEAELGSWANAKRRFACGLLRASTWDGAATVEWPALLARVACPALLMKADPALEALVTAESADRLRALVPGLRVAHVPEAGHNVRRE